MRSTTVLFAAPTAYLSFTSDRFRMLWSAHNDEKARTPLPSPPPDARATFTPLSLIRLVREMFLSLKVLWKISRNHLTLVLGGTVYNLSFYTIIMLFLGNVTYTDISQLCLWPSFADILLKPLYFDSSSSGNPRCVYTETILFCASATYHTDAVQISLLNTVSLVQLGVVRDHSSNQVVEISAV